MSIKFQQNTIHDTKGDFVKAKHLRICGKNEEIGYKLGEIAKNVHKLTRTKNNDELKYKCQKKYLKDNYPIHYNRMTGLAKAYSEDIENTCFDFTCFGNPLDAIACSAVYYPPEFTESKSGVLSRNLDLPTISFSKMISGNDKNDVPATSNMYVVELYPDMGYSSLINMSFELYGLGLDGINSEGLTVTHLYADSVNSNSYKPTKESGVGINEMLVVQLLLDNCKTTDNAKQMLLQNKHFYMLLPIHLIVADRFGQSFVWEYSPQHNKEYIINGNSKVQIITNFLLHQFPNSDEFPESIDKSCPFSRYKTIEKVSKNTDVFTIDKIKEINTNVFITDEMFKTKQAKKERTIYHNIYNINEKSMEVSYYRKDSGDSQSRTEYFKFQLEV